MNPVDFRFYAITDRKLAGMETILARLDHGFQLGLKSVQLREKDMPADKILRLAAEVRKTARPTGAKVLINDRVDVALAADLDGVHLPEGGLPVKDARRLLGDAPLLGISAHGLERVLQGAGEGADFCVAGPLSESASKEKGHWIMPERIFEEICARSPIPVFALGGVGLEDISRWMDLGAYGIAGISLWLSPDSRDNIFTVIQKTLGSL